MGVYLRLKFCVFELLNWISSQKRKSTRNRFSLFMWSPSRVFWAKKIVVKILMTLSGLSRTPNITKICNKQKLTKFISVKKKNRSLDGIEWHSTCDGNIYLNKFKYRKWDFLFSLCWIIWRKVWERMVYVYPAPTKIESPHKNQAYHIIQRHVSGIWVRH